MGGIISGIGTVGMGIANADAQHKTAFTEYGDTERELGYAERETARKGALDAARVRLAGSQMVDKQRLAYTNSGVDATSGTPVSVMADTRLMSELDASTVENDAARKVWGYKMQKQKALQNLNTQEGNIDRSAIGSVLSGFGQALGGGSGFGGIGG